MPRTSATQVHDRTVASTGYATMSVAGMLAESAKRFLDNVAVVVGPQESTYRGLLKRELIARFG